MVESEVSRPEGAAAGCELLPAGQVDIWLLRTDTAPTSCLDALRRLLSPEELERNARFRFPRDRDLHACGRGLVRTLLSRYAPRRPQEWLIPTEPGGRPLVANPSPGMPLDFSISHTPGLVAVAVGRDVRVGLDVEGPRPDLFSDPAIARAILSPEEEHTLAMTSPEERPDRFRRLWVLKEAYGKARGTGLADRRIRDVAFDTDDKGSIRMRLAGVVDRSANSEEWWFHEEGLDGGFRLALAVHAPSQSPHSPGVREFDCKAYLAPTQSGSPS